MKQYRIETHSHSCHSFDCNTPISSIISSCVQKGIDFIVINDHDVCGILEEDVDAFSKKGIDVLKAIEFTTTEGVHIIGVHPNIKYLQCPEYSYSAIYIVNALLALEAFIIIPHPNHITGILGNEKISQKEQHDILSNAHFIEVENFKYGSINTKNFTAKYPRLRSIVGSDAHSASKIGALLNEFTSADIICNPIEALYNSTSIKSLYLQKHYCGYWLLKRLKKTFVYQFFLNLFSPELRRIIKNMIPKR